MIITTKRLIIQRATPEDVSELRTLLADQRLLLLSRLTISPTLSAIAMMIETLHPLVIRQQNAPKHIIGMLTLQHRGEKKWELGYLLQASLWGRGIMTEAVAGIVSQLKTGTSIIAFVELRNRGSQLVLERNGFRRCQEDAWQICYQYDQK